MLTKPIAVVGLLAAVIAAAGAGAYLAVRQNTAEQHVAEHAASPAPDVAAADAVDAVAATEQVVSEATEPEAPPPAPAPAPERVVETATAPPAPEPPLAPVTTRSEPPTPIAEPPTIEEPPSEDPLPRPAITDQPAAEPAATAAGAGAPAAPAEPSVNLPAIDGWERPAGAAPDTAVTAAERPAPIDAVPVGASRRDDGLAGTIEPEPEAAFTELEIAADAVIGLQVENGVSTRTAEVEDRVEARVTRDVLVAEQVAVPAGTRVLGSVVLSEQGGKIHDASRLGVRFHTLVMGDGYRVPMDTETIYREGESRGKENVAKIGGAAVGGAILGAIFGGGRGAAIGGSIGAAGGTAAALGGDAEPAGLPPGSRLTVRLSRPVIVSVEQ